MDPRLLQLPKDVHRMFHWYVIMGRQEDGHVLLTDQTRLDRRTAKLVRLGLVTTHVEGGDTHVTITDTGREVATVLRLGGNLSPDGDGGEE